MDALALLCTLHADGPTTWRRLRENGCRSLAELARFEPEELSLILGGTSAGARRFLREARHLGERAGNTLLEREEPTLKAVADPGAPAPAEVEVEEVALPTRDQEIVDNVLRAWREQDTRASEEPLPSRPEFTSEPEVVVIPFAGQLALEANLIDGLSESACESLRAEGVHSLEMLLEADLGQLALRSGLGYSRLYRWRSLAERRLRSEARELQRREEQRLSPAELPVPAPERDLLQIPARGVELPRRTLRWSPLEEGAAGPFA